MSQPCTYCGHMIPAAAKFCSRCGAPTAGDLVRSATRVTPLMQQWRKLSARLTRREARQLLGEPARVELGDPSDPSRAHVAPTIESWIYEYEVVGHPDRRVQGLVRISVPEGRVLSWTEPDWNALALPIRTPSAKDGAD